MSTGALFHDVMSKTTGVGMSDLVISEQNLARWQRFSGFYESHEPLLLGEARSITGAPPWPSKWSVKVVHCIIIVLLIVALAVAGAIQSKLSPDGGI